MKKWLILLLILLFSYSGCASNSDDTEYDTSQPKQAAQSTNTNEDYESSNVHTRASSGTSSYEAKKSSPSSSSYSSSGSSYSSSDSSYSSSDTGDKQTTTVYVTNTGSKYHRSGCQYLSKSKIPISLSDAKSEGYGACKKCHPPT